MVIYRAALLRFNMIAKKQILPRSKYKCTETEIYGFPIFRWLDKSYPRWRSKLKASSSVQLNIRRPLCGDSALSSYKLISLSQAQNSHFYYAIVEEKQSLHAWTHVALIFSLRKATTSFTTLMITRTHNLEVGDQINEHVELEDCTGTGCW